MCVIVHSAAVSGAHIDSKMCKLLVPHVQSGYTGLSRCHIGNYICEVLDTADMESDVTTMIVLSE